jgi:2-(1,2-epoxy-1,2-dihydrophenyl)acetyl-CoA isomerase
MMLLGERVPAATALEWGMVNRLVAPEALLETAMALATSLGERPTRALAQIRRLCWAATELSFTEMVTAEREAQRDAGRYVDHREGVAAFLGERRAAFSGD